MFTTWKRPIRTTVCAMLCAALFSHAASAAYPDRPVKVVVGYAPGGPTDVVARAVFAKVAEQVGQPFIIENRPGANGNVGMLAVSRSNPDGYTLLYATSGVATNPGLYRSEDFDVKSRLIPVSLLASIPQVILAAPAFKANDAKSWAEEIRRHPGEYFYASSGMGNGNHLAMAVLLDSLNLKAEHVPYKGSSPALTDLMANRAQFMFDTVNTTLPMVSSGHLKAIAIGSLERLPIAPDVPTVSESLKPGFEVGTWHGLWAPKNTEPEVVDALNQAVVRALQDPALRATLEKQGVLIRGTSAQAFGQYYDGELARWNAVTEKLGIKPE